MTKPKPHDALFKLTFSAPERAAELLRCLIPERIGADIDWSTLQLCPASFVDQDLQQSHADLLFRVQAGAEERFLYILKEHKSAPDPRTSRQVLGYMLEIWSWWERQASSHDPRCLPVIVPVVIYHGEPGAEAPRRLRRCFQLPVPRSASERRFVRGLAQLIPDYRLFSLDLANAREEYVQSLELSPVPRLAVLCFRLHGRGSGGRLLDDLLYLADALRGAQLQPGGPEAAHAALRYMIAIRDVTEEDRTELFEFTRCELGPETETTMRTLFDQIKDEGRAEGQARLLLKLMTERFGEPPPEVVQRVRAATAAELDTWAVRILTAATLDEVLR